MDEKLHEHPFPTRLQGEDKRMVEKKEEDTRIGRGGRNPTLKQVV